MVGLWLAWAVVSIGMQLLWTCITLPYTPSVRGFASVFQLAWGIHYFIVIKTHFTRVSLCVLVCCWGEVSVCWGSFLCVGVFFFSCMVGFVSVFCLGAFLYIFYFVVVYVFV